MSVSWIPSDPDAYLHPEYHNSRLLQGPDWQEDYARWRHCYLPGLGVELGNIAPGRNASALYRAISLFEEVITELIPAELMKCVYDHNPDDWYVLPEAQVRSIWKAERVLFANIVRCMIGLQILRFINDGQLSDLTFNRKLEILQRGVTIREKITAINPIVAELKSLELDENDETVFKQMSVHLAVLQTVSTDLSYWEKLSSNEELLREFSKFTLQQRPASLLKDFASGRLVTVSTANQLTRWYAEKQGEILSWRYVDHMGNRTRAADDEIVPYVDKSTKFAISNI